MEDLPLLLLLLLEQIFSHSSGAIWPAIIHASNLSELASLKLAATSIEIAKRRPRHGLEFRQAVHFNDTTS